MLEVRELNQMCQTHSISLESYILRVDKLFISWN